jgi:hypothetical protein
MIYRILTTNEYVCSVDQRWMPAHEWWEQIPETWVGMQVKWCRDITRDQMLRIRHQVLPVINEPDDLVTGVIRLSHIRACSNRELLCLIRHAVNEQEKRIHEMESRQLGGTLDE